MRQQENFVYTRQFRNLHRMTANPESRRKRGAPTCEQDNNIKININPLKPSVYINRVLRRVFGPKRDEVTREWRKLHKEELRDLFSIPNIVRMVKSRKMRLAGHVARMGEGRGVHRFLVGKPEGKWPLGRPRRRWEDNIKMDLQEVGGGSG